MRGVRIFGVPLFIDVACGIIGKSLLQNRENTIAEMK